ncbi:porin [Myroides sp. N17-2]|uniref:porin n=1 Tax=Myroides sp. N17-2 TaxID=2030799 RepID=UPI000EFB2AF8|nr:porin [Myroides sp. N17-2]
MKRVILALMLCTQVGVFAQEPQTTLDSISKPIIPLNKQNLLKDVDVIFNTRFGFDNYFDNGTFTNSEFNNNQFRLEIKGKIHERVYFRFRDRYTQQSEIGSRDHITRGTDMAFIGIYLTPNTRLDMGKMSADWGGYEFDMNPIDILEYNDLLNHADNFLTGVGITHKLKNGHSFGFQALNSRTKTFEEQYVGYDISNLEKAKMPLALVGNWRGTFFDGKFETNYSYSYFQEAKNKAMNYISLGNKYQDDKLTLMYDFQYSKEDLDRKGMITSMVNNKIVVDDDGNKGMVSENVAYMDNWIRADYLVSPKVNLSLTLMTSNAYGKNLESDNSGMDRMRTSYGFIPTVQYIPFKDINVRFYVSYIGKYYNYSSLAKDKFGLENYNTGRISIGLVAPLLVL